MRLHVRQLACLLMLLASLNATASPRAQANAPISTYALTRLIGVQAQLPLPAALHTRLAEQHAEQTALTPRTPLAPLVASMQPAAAHSALVQHVTSLRH